MATALPPPGTALSPEQAAQQVQLLKRNVSIALAIACPILILLPPRKLDIYTFSLAGTAFASLNHLQKHRTGTSFLNHIGVGEVYTYSPYYKAPGTVEVNGGGDWSFPTEKARAYSAMVREQKAAQGNGQVGREERGILQRAWLGGEGADWREKRDAKEKEALESGEGVGKLIQDYVAEAFNGKQDGDDGEADEQVKR